MILATARSQKNKYDVVRSTLQRRHRDQMRTRELTHLALNPQHEYELVQYIKELTERRTPPTRAMIRNFASFLVGREVSYRWVSRFLNRNNNRLVSRWQTGMDRDRHKADLEARYSLYFDLLHDKMEENGILSGQTYNMDEKGLMIGVTGRSKRIFDSKMYMERRLRQASKTAVESG
jgi:hypothetical protein